MLTYGENLNEPTAESEIRNRSRDGYIWKYYVSTGIGRQPEMIKNIKWKHQPIFYIFYFYFFLFISFLFFENNIFIE